MSMPKSHKVLSRIRRHARIRSRVHGTAARPRLAVFRSNKFIYAQLIDDVAGVTLAAAHDMKIAKGTKMERAKQVGTTLAKAALAKDIQLATFDRGGFMYTGRIAAVAEAAREAGLTC